MLLFIFAIASNILALLAALIIVFILRILIYCGASPGDRAIMVAGMVVSIAIPAVGFILCFTHLLKVAIGVGLLAIAGYVAAARFLLPILEVAVRP